MKTREIIIKKNYGVITLIKKNDQKLQIVQISVQGSRPSSSNIYF